MIDIILLRIMKNRRDYDKLKTTVPLAAIDPKTKALLDDFGKYFSKFPDHDSIRHDVFIPRMRQWHPAMTEEQFNVYKGMLRQLNEEVEESTKDGILSDLYELSLGTSVANTLAKYDEGELSVPLSDILSMHLDAYKINAGIRSVPWNDKSFEELLLCDVNNEGVKWRLQCLNDAMRPLIGGDFGIIAGRPDKGKTSLISSELPYMVPQLNEEKNALWLNNEGHSDRIKKRLFQSTFGMTWTDLRELQAAGTNIQEAYAKVLGRRDRIRVIDIHGMHVGQVEAIIEMNNPGIVIFDMIDNIKGFGGEARTDLQLEEMYKWARERCVKYDFIGLATSQISAEGDGLQYPTLSMLKDSKTGKQGACDFQLMIGASNETHLQYSRFLSLPKNKLRRDDAPGDPHCEVIFKPTIARYEDIQNGD